MNCWCALLGSVAPESTIPTASPGCSKLHPRCSIPYQYQNPNPLSLGRWKDRPRPGGRAWLYPYGMLSSRGLVRYRTRVIYQTLRKGGGQAARPTPRLIYIYVLTQDIFTWYVTPHNLVKNINLNASISFTYNSRQNPNLTAGFFFRSSP